MAAGSRLIPIADALRRIARDLESIEGRVALVGGLAVSARAEPRFTRDVDFVVAVGDDQAAERIIFALQGRGYTVHMLLEHDKTGRLATVRLLPPGGDDGGLLADLLFASTGIEAEIVAGADPLEVLPRLVIPVASVGHLIAMKLLSHDADRRPRDAEDLLSLLGVATAPDLAACCDALALITERGAHRGKDLGAELARFQVRARGREP